MIFSNAGYVYQVLTTSGLGMFDSSKTQDSPVGVEMSSVAVFHLCPQPLIKKVLAYSICDIIIMALIQSPAVCCVGQRTLQAFDERL